MARKSKKEAVTVSFHYLVRQQQSEDEGVVQTGFTEEEFQQLCKTILALQPMDLSDEAVKDRVRFKKAVPIENSEQVNGRTLFSGYRAGYWGHAYDNTAVGKIPADSISLRPFYFIIYHAKNGRIYLGVQYLGQFGSYEGVKNTLISFLSDQKSIIAHSFRQDSTMFEDVEPSELHVTIARRPTDIAAPSKLGDEALVTFKKKARDTSFGNQVRERLLPVMGTNVAAIKKAASDIINDSGLIDVTDADVADCTVVGRVNGHRKTVYMISQGLFATTYHINPTFNIDGHPDAEPTKDKMIHLLKSKIISVISDA